MAYVAIIFCVFMKVEFSFKLNTNCQKAQMEVSTTYILRRNWYSLDII